MLNPIISQRRHLLVYIAAFAIVALIHFAILKFFLIIELAISLADAAIYTVLMFLLGIGSWYIVRHLTISEQKYPLVIADHLVAGGVVILLWLFGGYFFLLKIFQNSTGYIEFLHNTLPWRFVYGMMMYAVIVMVYYLIGYYRDFNEKLLQESHLKQAVQESELNLLKSQINPHFLFNSLNSINALVLSDSSKASEMIVELSEFLRYTVRANENEQISLHDELENIDRYLNIEKIRFGNRLVIEKDIDDACLEIKIPNMILQPLYENAVKHGVNESTEAVTISTTCRNKGDHISLVINNNFAPGSISKKGKGIGIANVKKRLSLQFKHTDLLYIQKTGNIFTVNLTIPFQPAN
jgi:two-component system, LytTR family, sensor kinase